MTHRPDITCSSCGEPIDDWWVRSAIARELELLAEQMDLRSMYGMIPPGPATTAYVHVKNSIAHRAAALRNQLGHEADCEARAELKRRDANGEETHEDRR